MLDRSKRKSQIGDIVEIQTPHGLAYAQYSHYSPRMGDLIRVLPGFYRDKPKSFKELVALKERFFVFYPLRAAVKQNLISVVAHEDVPPEAREFPLMRMPGLPDLDGQVHDWWLFDGKKERPIGKLTSDQAQLLIAEVWSHPVLVQRITESWNPARFGELLGEKGSKSNQDKTAVIYYLYSLDWKAAQEIARLLEGEECGVEVRKAADGASWLILVSCLLDSSTKIREMSSRVQALATSLDITYDGEEIAL